MSELLDKQVYVLKECNSGIHGGGHANPRKVCNGNKEKNNGHVKIFDRKDFVWLLLKLDMTDVDELQDNNCNSSHNKVLINR